MGGKEYIIVSQGHKYLFWATGVYYLWALAKKYEIGLIVREEYRNDEKFVKICDELGINNIYYIPEFNDLSFFDHRKYFKFYRSLLSEKKPIGIVQHDYIEICNMYLNVLSKKLYPGIKNLVIETSQPSKEDTNELFRKGRYHNSKKLAKKLHLPAMLIYILVNIYKAVTSTISNFILPFLSSGVVSYLTPSLFNNADNIPTRIPFDYYLMTRKEDKDFMVSLLKCNPELIALVSPPMVSYGEEVNDFLYEKFVEEKSIVFLPSHLSLKKFIDNIPAWKKWANVLRIIQADNPSHILKVKLHPSTLKHKEGSEIKSFLAEHVPGSELLNAKNEAMVLISSGEIIVGDVSTTIIHSCLMKNKKVLCFDLGETPGSDSLKNFQGINYIYFNDVDLETRLKNLKYSKPMEHEQKVDILGFCENWISKSD